MKLAIITVALIGLSSPVLANCFTNTFGNMSTTTCSDGTRINTNRFGNMQTHTITPGFRRRYVPAPVYVFPADRYYPPRSFTAPPVKPHGMDNPFGFNNPRY